MLESYYEVDEIVSDKNGCYHILDIHHGAYFPPESVTKDVPLFPNALRHATKVKNEMMRYYHPDKALPQEKEKAGESSAKINAAYDNIATSAKKRSTYDISQPLIERAKELPSVPTVEQLKVPFFSHLRWKTNGEIAPGSEGSDVEYAKIMDVTADQKLELQSPYPPQQDGDAEIIRVPVSELSRESLTVSREEYACVGVKVGYGESIHSPYLEQMCGVRFDCRANITVINKEFARRFGLLDEEKVNEILPGFRDEAKKEITHSQPGGFSQKLPRVNIDVKFRGIRMRCSVGFMDGSFPPISSGENQRNVLITFGKNELNRFKRVAPGFSFQT